MMPIQNAIPFIDPRYYKPTEVYMLLGNSDKARRVLGWQLLNHLRGIETATLASLDPHFTWRLFVAMRQLQLLTSSGVNNY
jgi:hypothetical protein